MVHRVKILLLLLISFSVLMPEIPVIKSVISIEEAQAQEKKKRKSLFDLIRERRAKRKERRAQRARAKAAREQAKQKASRQNVRNRKSQKKRRSLFQRLEPNSNVAGTEEDEFQRRFDPSDPRDPASLRIKEEDAAKILVVGDFIATGIARELTKLYATNPRFRVVSKTSPSSGIVRYDVVNWEAEIPELIERHKPIAIVNLLGMNDRQAMRLPGGRLQPMTEEWIKEYEARVSKLAGYSLRYNTPMLWVGLPPVRFSKMNRDYLTFNELYRSKIEAVGGTFVDVWDGFTNEDGKFVSAGPDINGQIVRLRGSKGINMTRSGSRKLAFYVDKELRKFGISPDATQVQVAAAGSFRGTSNQVRTLQYDPATSGTTVVISLGAASAVNIEPLAGNANFLVSEDRVRSVSYSLVEKGVGFRPRFGRVDASWGDPSPITRRSDMSDEQKQHILGTPAKDLQSKIYEDVPHVVGP